MKTSSLPAPSVAFNKFLAANAQGPFVGVISGEFTTSTGAIPLGAASRGGRVAKVWMSVLASGKDDSNTLSATVDVQINGTTCLSTQPIIAHVSGEASQQKTTIITGDTGITASAMDADANTFVAGDVLTYDMTLTRTASPTTEMQNMIIVVEVEPAEN